MHSPTFNTDPTRSTASIRHELQRRLSRLADLGELPYSGLASFDPVSLSPPPSPPPATSTDTVTTEPLLPSPLAPSSPEPAMATSNSSLSSSSIYRDSLQRIGDLSTATWAKWEDLLPTVVGALANVPSANFYLDGTIKRDDYKKEEIAEVLNDSTKKATFETWIRLAKALKTVVTTYGGTDAEARVEAFDASLGDAPGLWAKLKGWYGETDTGAEKVVLLTRLVNDRWDGVEAVNVYLSRILALRNRINAAYRSDAEKATDKSDLNVKADLAAAISDSLLRDLVLTSLPDSYADALLPSISRTTTFSQLVTLVSNRYLTLQSREEIAEIESARRVTPAPPAPSPEPRSSGAGKRSRGPPWKTKKERLAATRYPGYERWRGGTFTDGNGMVRFKVPNGTCFRCFRDGHIARECREKNTARARVEELGKNGITVPIAEADALIVFDLNRDASHDSSVVAALLAREATPSSPAEFTDDDLVANFAVIASDIGPERCFFVVDTLSYTSPLDVDPTELSALRTTVRDDNRYILDSGASRHFTTRLNDLHNYLPYATPRTIGGAFGSVGHALGEGDLIATFPSGPIRIGGVMYAPSLGVNLISQTRLMMAGMRFSNTREVLRLESERGSLIAELPMGPSIAVQASLFLPSRPSPSRPLRALPVETRADQALRWHRRLGHLSMARLKQLLGSVGAAGTETLTLPQEHCDACERGKAARQPVAKEALHPPTRRLELVVADTWGPAPVRGVKGERFALVVVDGYSRYAWGATMAQKSAIAATLINRMRRVQRASGVAIAALQTDNGTEFVNSTVGNFLSSEGIQHRRTVAYVHGQNGLVERRWRLIFDTARTLLLDSGLPLWLWPYAFDSALHTYNLSPSSALGNRTPHELFHGAPPDLSHLRAWGCVAWLRLSPEGPRMPHKLEPRGIRARFIGYPEDNKGWIFWIPEQRKVVVGWNARFEEDNFASERDAGEDAALDRVLELMRDEADKADDGRDSLGEEEGGVQEGRPSSEEEHDHDDPTPPDSPLQHAPPAPLPPPTPPPQPEIRRSSRLAGVPGQTLPHFVPLDGAPQEAEAALTLTTSTFAAPSPISASAFPTRPRTPPAPLPSLAFAVYDPDLDESSPACASLSFDATAVSSPAELRASLDTALATGPAWTGSLDQPTYKQAMSGPDVEKWIEAMMAELGAFEATGTWEGNLVDLPPGRKAIAVKWVLLVKRDAEGRILKYKARLVARGDMQIEGVDYEETHSSTVRLTTVRLVFAILAAHPAWAVRQFDISNAYLLGKLDNTIYIRQPPGFTDPARPSAVRRLKKALYGLKQGGREWQRVLRSAMERVGFTRCAADHGLYVRRKGGRTAMVATHVDDGIMIGDDDLEGILRALDAELSGKLKVVDSELFLGMRVKRSDDGTVTADQHHYTTNVLQRFFPNGLSPVATPLDSSYTSITAATEDERHACDYRELLGALIYLSACTRPDIAFALSFASRFASCPAKRHWTLLTHICRYLAGSSSLGLVYTTPTTPFSAELVTGWSGADHGTDKDTRRSVSGYVLSGYVFGVGDDSLRSTAISWLSRRQKSVAISSTEAEYMGLSEAAREAIWLRQLLREMGFATTRATLIRGDNSGSLLLSSHPTSHSRTKHIAIHYHFTRERVEGGEIVLKWVSTKEMVGDVFTKGLPKVQHVVDAVLGECTLEWSEPSQEGREHLRSEDEDGTWHVCLTTSTLLHTTNVPQSIADIWRLLALGGKWVHSGPVTNWGSIPGLALTLHQVRSLTHDLGFELRDNGEFWTQYTPRNLWLPANHSCLCARWVVTKCKDVP
ncbi:hypothetical protein JCM5296_001279 [Sporobolomyces johnsonii]